MILDNLFVLSQYLTPQHTLSRTVGMLADCKQPQIKDTFIKWFINRYNVDMSEAATENPSDFPCFNDFFTRELKPGLRPVAKDENLIACPVDGTVSQLGDIVHGQIFQAKGQQYSLIDLLGGNVARAKPFMGGKFATIYLSPKDYHRIHMPFPGTLREMVYVPGKLFSVNPITTEKVPGLFARNERLVTLFDTEFGPMAVILVGAMIVASIETAWSGQVAPPVRKLKVTEYPAEPTHPIHLDKGDELGRFKLGSTVVLAFPENAADFSEELMAGSVVRMGQTFGKRPA